MPTTPASIDNQAEGRWPGFLEVQGDFQDVLSCLPEPIDRWIEVVGVIVIGNLLTLEDESQCRVTGASDPGLEVPVRADELKTEPLRAIWRDVAVYLLADADGRPVWAPPRT